MISQEDKAADRELEEIGNIDWLAEISALNKTAGKINGDHHKR